MRLRGSLSADVPGIMLLAQGVAAEALPPDAVPVLPPIPFQAARIIVLADRILTETARSPLPECRDKPQEIPIELRRIWRDDLR